MKKQNAKTVQAQIIKSLELRIKNADNSNAAKTLTVELKKFSADSMQACINTMINNGYDFTAFNNRLMNSDKNAVEANDYIALYALQKVRKALHAIGANIVLEFDGYTLAILSNLSRLQSLSTMNAQRTIARKIEFGELEQVVTLKNRMNCQPSTASTQASSTREMLRILDICTVVKKHKNDSISFNETAQSKAVQAMFSAMTA